MKEKLGKVYFKIVFLVEIILSLLMGIATFRVLYKVYDMDYISVPNLTVAIICAIILLVIIICNVIRYKKKVEKLFLTFIIPIGIMFIILLPINCVPDEDSHTYKTYDLSVGHIITPFGENKEGNIYVPKQFVDFYEQHKDINYSVIHEYLSKDTNYKELVPVQTIAKTYFFINYMPGAIVFIICRLLNINIILACYIIRLVNFILSIIIGYYCIKVIPFGKLVLAIYMFLPMYIQQIASISADAIINSISILFIVYNLKLLWQKEDMRPIQRMIYYVLALSISVCKYVYFPLTLMSLLLIKNKNISKINKNKLITISLSLSVVVAIFWFVFSQQYIDTRQIIIERNVKPIQQITYILQKPVEYTKIFFNTFEEKGAYYVKTFLGSELGLLNIKIPEIYIIIYMISLSILPFLEKNEKSLTKMQKWLMIVISLILILLVETGLYITWSGLKTSIIEGVQGRYFIPVFILILLSIINKNNKIEIKNLGIKYFILYFVLNILTLTKIYTIFIQ